jgi:hypothetical protein
MIDDWSTEFPQEEGLYWFYGYRYGKISVGQECEPEHLCVKVMQIGDGSLLYITDGAAMYESEVECPHFKKIVVPELPIIK